MKDRTSYSYRGDTPGPNPDMYQKGGQAREAFREARMSPYIRNEVERQSQGAAQLDKEQFRAMRKPQITSPKMSRDM